MNFDLNKFQKNINVKFQDTKLLKKSLTHKSINKTYNNEQLEFLGDVVRLYHSKKPEYPGNALLKKHFPEGKYQDVKGLCKIASIEDVKEQDYSLNPGRYVGIKPLPPMQKEEFEKKIKEFDSKFSTLSKEAHNLEEAIASFIDKLI